MLIGFDDTLFLMVPSGVIAFHSFQDGRGAVPKAKKVFAVNEENQVSAFISCQSIHLSHSTEPATMNGNEQPFS